MMWTSIALVGLSTIVGATNGVAEQMSALVQGCAQQDAGACERLSAQLTARFAGASATDRQAGARLAARAAQVVRRADVGRVCSDGDARACESLVRVLEGLFTGDDGRLERSADRALAHAVAANIVAGGDGVAAAPSDEQEALARFRAAAALATAGHFAEAAREYLASFRARAWPESLLAAAESCQRAAHAPQARCVYRLYVALFPRAPSVSRARTQIAELGGSCPIAVR